MLYLAFIFFGQGSVRLVLGAPVQNFWPMCTFDSINFYLTLNILGGHLKSTVFASCVT